MDATVKKIAETLAIGAVKKGLIGVGGVLAGHGIAMGFTTTDYAAASVAIVAAGYSFWNDYGKAIVLSQLEVFKAKSLAQAEKMRMAGVAPVTADQIAMQSSKMNTAEVAKVVATLPEEVQRNVQPMAATVAKIMFLAFLCSAFLASAPVAMAQIKIKSPDQIR